jgi:hypothetical protein
MQVNGTAAEGRFTDGYAVGATMPLAWVLNTAPADHESEVKASILGAVGDPHPGSRCERVVR